MDEAAEQLQAAVRLRRGQTAVAHTADGHRVQLRPIDGRDVRVGDVVLAEVEKRTQLARVTHVRLEDGTLRLQGRGRTTFECVFGKVIGQ